MSAPDLGRGHERARELAALRVDHELAPGDDAWLADHLDFCDACAAVAAEYVAQHDLFADALAWSPEPPRDLWARTSASIEAEGRRRGGSRGRRAGRPLAVRLSLAPLIAAMAVIVVMTAALLNGAVTTPGGTAAGPTPIALANAADVQVITRDSNGNLQLLSRPINAVCPSGVSNCGAEPTFAVTAVNGVMSATTLQGAVSPSGDNLVVVASGGGGDGVYVVPVRPAATPAPSPASTPRATLATPAPASHVSPSSDAHRSEAPAPSTASVPSSPAPVSASPTDLVAGTATPPPTAAIKIASDVKVVGVPVYAPDGQHLAFSAVPADGSLGPDVYVWSAGDATAHAVTADHGSWLVAWTPEGILLSRIVDGVPRTQSLDLATGVAADVGAPGIWLPELAPDGRTAAWWAGTVKLAADGVSWVPDAGAVVEGSWPATADEPTRVLAAGPLVAWRVRWADDGSAVAVWSAALADGESGRLSLYRVIAPACAAAAPSGSLDAGSGALPAATSSSPAAACLPEASVRSPVPSSSPADVTNASPGAQAGSPGATPPSESPIAGLPDLANPLLDAVPANPDFSLRAGRLVWTSPSTAGPRMVEVLAWVGSEVGRLEIPADGAGTVLP